MFYLLKKTKVSDCEVGEKVMVLSDFNGIEAGEKGTITENYGTGIMIRWDPYLGQDINDHTRSDGFAEDELEYLGFATEKHPRVEDECLECGGKDGRHQTGCVKTE